MNITLFCYDRDSGFTWPLPHASFSFNTPKFPTVPALSLKYPLKGTNAQQLLRDREVYAAFDLDPGSAGPGPGRTVGLYEPWNARWLLEDPVYTWDESTNIEYATWACRGIIASADRAMIYPGYTPAAHEDMTTFWQNMFVNFQSRGGNYRCLPTGLPGTFGYPNTAWPKSNGVDPDGGGAASFKYDLYQDYLAGLISCVDDYQIMDLRVKAEGIIFWPPGMLGDDYSSIIWFIPGTNVIELQDSDSLFKDVRNTGVIQFSDGSVISLIHSDNWNGIGGTDMRFGGIDRRETVITSDWPTDPAYPTLTIAQQVTAHYPQVKTFAVQSLDQVSQINPSVSFTVPESSRWLPWRDFEVFDTIAAPRMAGGWTPLQVVDISCTRDDDGSTRYGIVCGEPRSSVTEKLSAYARSHFGKHTKVGKELWKTYQHW